MPIEQYAQKLMQALSGLLAGYFQGAFPVTGSSPEPRILISCQSDPDDRVQVSIEEMGIRKGFALYWYPATHGVFYPDSHSPAQAARVAFDAYTSGGQRLDQNHSGEK